MMSNHSLTCMHSSFLFSVSFHTTLLLLLSFFLYSLSHLINPLSFLFTVYYCLSRPSIFTLLSFRPSTPLLLTHPLALTLTLALTHSAVPQWLNPSHKVPKCQTNSNKSQEQQKISPSFSKEPPERNASTMSLFIS